jgi:hypothetical protein
VSAPEEITADDIRQADARRDLEKLLPPADELFPGMLEERVRFYVRQLTFHAIDNFANAAFWWESELGPRARAYLCRLAHVDKSAAAQPWRDLSFVDRARLVCRFMWLHDWVANTGTLPLTPAKERVFPD